MRKSPKSLLVNHIAISAYAKKCRTRRHFLAVIRVACKVIASLLDGSPHSTLDELNKAVE